MENRQFTRPLPPLFRLLLALLVSAATVPLAAGAQTGYFGSHVDDAMDTETGYGDEFDLRRIEAFVEGDTLFVAISTTAEDYLFPDRTLSAQENAGRFAPRIDLDTDQDASTGSPSTASFQFGAAPNLGVDYFIDFFSYQDSDSTVLVRDGLGDPAGVAKVSIGSFLTGASGRFVFVQIPLEVIGNDDGRVHVSVASGDDLDWADVAPDEDYVISRLASEVLLRDGRFLVTLDWKTAVGTQGRALPVFTSEDSTLLQFFSQDNWEMVVKVLDGCGINGHFWVYFGGPTDVGFTLTVTDLITGVSRTYDNPVGTAAPAERDIAAFPTCSGQI